MTACTEYCLKIFKDLILVTVSLPTRLSGEQVRKGSLGSTHNPEQHTFFEVSSLCLRIALDSPSRP